MRAFSSAYSSAAHLRCIRPRRRAPRPVRPTTRRHRHGRPGLLDLASPTPPGNASRRSRPGTYTVVDQGPGERAQLPPDRARWQSTCRPTSTPSATVHLDGHVPRRHVPLPVRPARDGDEGDLTVDRRTAPAATAAPDHHHAAPPPPHRRLAAPRASSARLGPGVDDGGQARASEARRIKAGRPCVITVGDRSTQRDNFHLTGPGVNRPEPRPASTVSWRLRLKRGLYR